MTKVVHPYAHRLGTRGIRGWKSRWSSPGSHYVSFLKTDIVIRTFLDEALKGMYVSDVHIERDEKNYKIIISTSRSGMIIGRSGDGVEKLLAGLKKALKKAKLAEPTNIRIEIEDIRSPESDAGVVAAQVVEALERRMVVRRVIKTTVEKCMANKEVLGVKVSVAGCLNGPGMARKESAHKGRIPLQTFRADVDYRYVTAQTAAGVLGVKVWIYRGEIFPDDKK